MRRKMTRAACYLMLAIALTGAGMTPVLAGESTEETFTGVLVPSGPAGPRAAMHFTVYIDSYSTEEERQTLARAVLEEGQEGFHDALRRMDKGRIQIGPRTGYTINAAFSIPTDRGRKIRLVTERPIAIAELYRDSRSVEYLFGFVEFEFEDDEEGAGQMVFAAQLGVDNETIELESFGVNPARLAGVRSR